MRKRTRITINVDADADDGTPEKNELQPAGPTPERSSPRSRREKGKNCKGNHPLSAAAAVGTTDAKDQRPVHVEVVDVDAVASDVPTPSKNMRAEVQAPRTITNSVRARQKSDQPKSGGSEQDLSHVILVEEVEEEKGERDPHREGDDPNAFATKKIPLLSAPTLPMTTGSTSSTAAPVAAMTYAERLEYGWIVRGRLPKHFRLMQSDGLEHLLTFKPDKYSHLQMYGRVIETPRYQRVYLRDYAFSGMHNMADPNIPDAVKEVLDWANSLRQHWTSSQDAGGARARTASTTIKSTPSESVPSDPANSKEEQKVLPKFNGCLVNFYMDGNHYIGPHADDERQLHRRSPIFSATIGQTRVFRLRDKTTNARVKDITLVSGDVVIMGGAMQEHYKHEITKVTGSKSTLLGPRVNITFRQFI